VASLGRRPRFQPGTGNYSIDARVRRVYDVRSAKCRRVSYDDAKLNRSTTLFIQFTDYELYDAGVTLSSIFHDVQQIDRETLAEIVLVDVASSLKHIQRDADAYVQSFRKSLQHGQYLPPIRLVRVEAPRSTSAGKGDKQRRWPLAALAEAATTNIVVFVDPGVVVGHGWLTPLVHPLLFDRKRRLRRTQLMAVESHLDRLRSPIDLNYRPTTDDMMPVPSWSLAVRMRRVPFRQESEEKKSNYSDNEVPLYRPAPVLRGSAFAVRIRDLKHIGGLFNEELDVDGGGEYLDLSLRLWSCGNGVQVSTARDCFFFHFERA
jgi:hypothetical protein